jgi:hypothetical protein
VEQYVNSLLRISSNHTEIIDAVKPYFDEKTMRRQSIKLQLEKGETIEEVEKYFTSE